MVWPGFNYPTSGSLNTVQLGFMPNAMEITVSIWRTIVVDNNVHMFNISAMAKNIIHEDDNLVKEGY
jgi:hypothetical protein